MSANTDMAVKMKMSANIDINMAVTTNKNQHLPELEVEYMPTNQYWTIPGSLLGNLADSPVGNLAGNLADSPVDPEVAVTTTNQDIVIQIP